MQSPDPARQHVKGVITAGGLMLVTVVSAVGLVAILFVGLGSVAKPEEPVAAGGRAPESSVALVSPATTTTTEKPAPTTTTVPPTTTTALPPPTAPALCIGDSVMQSASPKYYNLLGMCGVVDATVSRSWGAGAAAVQSHAPYPDRVVIHLGTNGFTNAGEIDATLQALAAVPRVVLLTVQVNGTRRWEAPVNAEILAAAARWPNVRIADWKAISTGHPEYFRADRIHPSQPGAVAYANLIAATL